MRRQVSCSFFALFHCFISRFSVHSGTTSTLNAEQWPDFDHTGFSAVQASFVNFGQHVFGKQFIYYMYTKQCVLTIWPGPVERAKRVYNDMQVKDTDGQDSENGFSGDMSGNLVQFDDQSFAQGGDQLAQVAVMPSTSSLIPSLSKRPTDSHPPPPPPSLPASPLVYTHNLTPIYA